MSTLLTLPVGDTSQHITDLPLAILLINQVPMNRNANVQMGSLWMRPWVSQVVGALQRYAGADYIIADKNMLSLKKLINKDLLYRHNGLHWKLYIGEYYQNICSRKMWGGWNNIWNNIWNVIDGALTKYDQNICSWKMWVGWRVNRGVERKGLLARTKVSATGLTSTWFARGY